MKPSISEEDLKAAIAALTPRMRRIIANAHTAAGSRGMSWIGTEHVLLALIEEGNGIAAQLLQQAEVSAALKDRIERLFETAGYWKTSTDLRPGPAEESDT